MTRARGHLIELNAAQLRGLTNWAPDERPRKIVEILVPTPTGPPVATVRDAVAGLARVHEGLRSRLVREADGGWRQLVLDRDAVARDLDFDTAEVPCGQDIPTLLAGLPALPVDPEVRGMRCVAYLMGGRVALVALVVSHVFADGVSQQVLYRTLAGVLDGDAGGIAEPGRQASDFSGDRLAAAVGENTKSWKAFLAAVPRSCTFTGARREVREEIRAAQLTLSSEPAARVVRASRALGVTPYTLWTAATSALVSQCTGEHAMVFKTQLANRVTPVEFEAVAQVAQGAFIPVLGRAKDSLRDRTVAVFEASMTGQSIGMYHWSELLSWLDAQPIRRGAAFRPAFEINYAASLGGVTMPQLTLGPDWLEFQEADRMDPHAAGADLAVAVWQEPGTTVVTLRARPPVWRVRSPGRLLDELMATVAALCDHPDRKIVGLPVARLPQSSDLIRGHASGVGIDPAMMRDLLLSHPRVTSGAVTALPRPGGPATLAAAVVVDNPVSDDELMCAYTERQRWLNGTVVPDELMVSVVNKGAST